MILLTHIIVAEAVTKPILNPFFVFFGALASHFLIDCIPHWDYDLSCKSDKKNPFDTKLNLSARNILIDAFKIGLDIAAGLIISFLIFKPTDLGLFKLAAFGAILPDILSAFFWISKNKILLAILKFHIYIQKQAKIFLGVLWQAFLILIAIFLFK